MVSGFVSPHPDAYAFLCAGWGVNWDMHETAVEWKEVGSFCLKAPSPPPQSAT